MDTQVALILGALIASVKGLGLVAIGAGFGWWRSRRRVKELEAQLLEAARGQQALGSGDAERLEQGIDYLAAQISTLADEQRKLMQTLPPPPSH
ncbi:MAG: hypothetical protein H0U85_03260 [Gemmatimonadales bacterium]|nr:hypothetical protein [Gemmatimonadales bacterium]